MKQQEKPVISVVIFTYNRASLLHECMTSVITQLPLDGEIIISDNHSSDNTEEVVKSFGDKRIKYFCNSSNIGLRGNLEVGFGRATSEIVFLMGDDDILLSNALEKTIACFENNAGVGLVTRPYYWFIDDVGRPVRAVKPFTDDLSTVIVNKDSDEKLLRKVYETAGQISGLAIKKSLVTRKFHEDIFTTHLYIFSELLEKAEVAILGEYSVAVRTNDSMCRHNPEIYDKSPTISWYEMFNEIFASKRDDRIRLWGIKFMAGHCEGLVQISCYGKLKQVVKEIAIQVYLRPLNILTPKYVFYAVVCLITPSYLLVKLVEFYKETVLARTL
jgi:glycosyltransferase involved in cell wall biosynthesis